MDIPATRAVVVTGVSTGIGWGTAQVLLAKGFHVFGSVRKAEDADRLRQNWGEAFTPLLFDVTDPRAVAEAARQVDHAVRGRTIAGLVNNAGIAMPAPLIHQAIEDFRLQLEVNVVGALIVTQAFVSLLGADRQRQGSRGRIVNVSSVGGQLAGPFLGAYCASKFALEGMSESLRRELMLHGIDVIVVGPGAVATPIWDKAEAVDLRAWMDTDYGPAAERFQRTSVDDGRRGLPPERVGEVIHLALTAPHPRTRYAVMRRPWRDGILPRLLSFLDRRRVDGWVARRAGLLHSQEARLSGPNRS